MLKRLAPLSAAVAAGAGLIYARFVEPDQLDIQQIDMYLPRLDPAFDGYRIVQVSDIHASEYMDEVRMSRFMERASRQNGDLIVFTGDLITSKVEYAPDNLVAALRLLTAPDGVLAVPGNHDHMEETDIENVRRVWHEAGIVDISNNYTTLERDGAVLHIAGIDSLYGQKADVVGVINQLPETGPVVLLAHEPDVADIIAPTHKVDLQLSGHTHGGQVQLPVIGALVGPPHGLRYTSGLYELEGMFLYVNRGLGTIRLPLRFNCPPEVTVITLRSAAG
jgi:hypothetical protein